MLGWRAVPVATEGLGETALSAMPAMEQLFVAPAPAAGHGRRPAGARAPGLRAAQAGRARRRRAVLPLAVVADAGLQGHADLRAAALVLHRPRGPAVRVGTGARALALLHQHLPELAPGPPVPLHGPQRGDQHPGRQPQLDAGPRGSPRRRALIAGRPRPHLPGVHPGGERLGQLRRGARAPAPGRAPASPRRAHDDPRGVGEPHHHGPRPAGVLPLPRLAHGALGRPGRGDLHRRHRGGRRAGPQRAAPGPLLGHRRRPGGAGQRGGRARHRTRSAIVRKGRLQPGRMFLVDTAKGRMVDDDEIKAELAAEHPYDEWLAQRPDPPR